MILQNNNFKKNSLLSSWEKNWILEKLVSCPRSLFICVEILLFFFWIFLCSWGKIANELTNYLKTLVNKPKKSIFKSIVFIEQRASLVAQMVKNPLAIWEIWVWFLGWEEPSEEGMATHFSILARRISMDRGAWHAISVSSTASQSTLVITFSNVLKIKISTV